MNPKRAASWATAICAGIVCLLVFLRALQCGFVNLDDPDYVYQNPAIRLLDWEFVLESFTTSYMGWWMPLTWISFALDYQIWQLNPFGYHLTNVLLHAANTTVVALIADQLLRTRIAVRHYRLVVLFAALLWGLHPLRVESVAWITERKDVLNGFFSLAAVFCYLRFAQSPSRAKGAYAGSLVLFLLGMMAKPISVVLPVLFLILDWYPLGRLHKTTLRAMLLEKLPFFLLGGLVALATVYCAGTGRGILVPLEDHSIGNRFLVGGYALIEYVRMSFWPTGLAHFYPLVRPTPSSYWVHSVIALIAISYAIHSLRKNPLLPAALGSFLLLLLPVLGFFQNGDQSHADRFTYLPSVLPSVAVAAMVVHYLERYAGKLPRFGGAAVITIGVSLSAMLGGLSFRQIGYWQDSGTLWSHLIQARPAGRAYFYRGQYLFSIGKFDAAASDLEHAVQEAVAAGNMEVYNVYALLGAALTRCGRYEEAVEAFSEAIAIYPLPNYFYHRAVALQNLGRGREATADLIKAGTDRGPITWVRLR